MYKKVAFRKKPTSLSEQDYIEIATSPLSRREIAEKYNIRAQTVKDIRSRAQVSGTPIPPHRVFLSEEQEREIGLGKMTCAQIIKKYKIGKHRISVLRAKYRAPIKPITEPVPAASLPKTRRRSGRPNKDYIDVVMLAEMLKKHSEVIMIGLRHELALAQPAPTSLIAEFVNNCIRLKLRLLGR